MTTETLTSPTSSATTTPATESSTYSVLGLVLSIVSIPTGMGPLAIAGVILGFIARGKEPASVTTANWAIIIGLLSLFGWIAFAFVGFALFAPLAVGAWATEWFWF